MAAVLAAAGVLACSDGPTEPAHIGDFTWTAPEVIPEMDGAVRADWGGDFIWNVTGLAVDGRGYVHLLASAGPRDPAWFEFGQVYHAVREPSGVWSAPVRLADSATYSYGAWLAVDASGTAHAIWYDRPRGSGQVTRLLHRRLQAGGAWSESESLYATAPGARPNPPLTSALDGTGRLHVIHNAQGGFAFLEHLTLDLVSGSWSAAAMDVTGYYPRLAAAHDGSLWLTYVAGRATESGTSSRQDVWVSRYDGSMWSEPERVHRDDRRYSHSPMLLWDKAARLHAVWQESEPDVAGISRYLFHATYRGASAGWGTPRDVTPVELQGRLFWHLHGFTDARGRPNVLIGSTDRSLENPRIAQVRLDGERWTDAYHPVGPAPVSSPQIVHGPDGRVHMAWFGTDRVLRYAVGELR